MSQTLKLVFAYSKEDEKSRQKLEAHLSFLYQKKVEVRWYQYHETEKNNLSNLTQTDIVGILVSPSFSQLTFTNTSCKYFINKAINLCNQQKICLIPILLIRFHNWQDIFQGIELQPLPKNCKFVKSWQNKDEAYVDIAQGIEEAVQKVLATKNQPDFSPIYVEKISNPLQVEEKKMLNLYSLSNIFREISFLTTKLFGYISFLPQRVIKRKRKNRRIHKTFVLATILGIMVLTWPKLQAMSQRVSSVINPQFLSEEKIQLVNIVNEYFSYVINEEQRELAWEMLDPKSEVIKGMNFKTYDQWWNKNISPQNQPEILEINQDANQVLVRWKYCHSTTQTLIVRTEKWKLKRNNQSNKWIVSPYDGKEKNLRKKC